VFLFSFCSLFLFLFCFGFGFGFSSLFGFPWNSVGRSFVISLGVVATMVEGKRRREVSGGGLGGELSDDGGES
jgi:hypothetical protein